MKSILFVALVVFGSIGVFAQERTISKAEFDVVFLNPNKWALLSWKGKSFRNIRTNEIKGRGTEPVDSFLKSTMEFVPNYAPESNLLYVTRSILENRSGSKITKTESIRIGDKNYKRKENEPWIVETVIAKSEQKTPDTPRSLTSLSNEVETIIETVSKEVERIIEYKYLGSEKFNNQTTNVYAVIMKIKYIKPVTNQERQNIKTTKYWFNEDGVMLKEDDVAESRSEPGTFTFYNHTTSVWELNPNIKIDAPVMK